MNDNAAKRESGYENPRTGGFTLVELLTALAVASIVLAASYTAFSNATRVARTYRTVTDVTECENGLASLLRDDIDNLIETAPNLAIEPTGIEMLRRRAPISKSDALLFEIVRYRWVESDSSSRQFIREEIHLPLWHRSATAQETALGYRQHGGRWTPEWTTLRQAERDSTSAEGLDARYAVTGFGAIDSSRIRSIVPAGHGLTVGGYGLQKAAVALHLDFSVRAQPSGLMKTPRDHRPRPPFHAFERSLDVDQALRHRGSPTDFAPDLELTLWLPVCALPVGD